MVSNSGMQWRFRLRALLAGAAFLTLTWHPTAGSAATPNTWKFDIVRLKNGRTYHGLLAEETRDAIKFWVVKLPPRMEAHRLWYTFLRSEVERIERLPPREREILAARVRALNPVVKVRDERERWDKIEKHLTSWGAGTGSKPPKIAGADPFSGPRSEGRNVRGWSYASDYFVLHSNAPREVVVRTANRLEQIYAAYADFFSRPVSAARPTVIILLQTLADYRAFLKDQGRNFFNPAYYDPGRNQIVCGSELKRLGEALKEVRQQEEELHKQRAYLNKRYKGKIPAVLLAQLRRDRSAIQEANKKNDAAFQEVSRRLFQTLYHEGFHAYLENFVFPSREAAVPLWLNEGLAQIFESAVIDSGALRVDHVDDKRLERVKALLKDHQVVPLADLLKAGGRQFHVTHASAQQLSDRYYLTSWALAYYLLVDQKLLYRTAKLDRYVKGLKRARDPLAAFRQLTGKPLADLERDLHAYLRRLQPDGSKTGGKGTR